VSSWVSRYKQIGRAVEQVQRLRVILGVFLKYGYGDLIHRLPLHDLWRSLPGRRFRRAQAEIARHPRPVRLRLAFEELGPTFVKFGQLLASRSRLLPKPYLDELARLHDHVPPIPFEEVQAVIAGELNRPILEVFAEVDPTPLGSASIAQVHPARLLDKTEVVVKVQRPEIATVIRTDLALMGHLAALVERHVEEWRIYNPSAIIAEFAHRMEKELDFSNEVAAMQRFSQQFAGLPHVRVPRVHRAQSTQRLLTMERIQGIPASHTEALDQTGLDRALLARRIVDVTLRQIFIHGFFHADPHPGNIHALPGNVLCFLDFGMTGFFAREARETLADLMIAVARQDESSGTAALLKLAGAELEPAKPGLEADFAELIHQNAGCVMGDLVFDRLLQHLFQLTYRHSLTLPPEVFTALKALGQIESQIQQLDPKLDLLAELEPFLKELRTARIRPRRLLRDLVNFGGEAMVTLHAMPLELRKIAALLRSGKSRVTFQVEGLAPLNEALERGTNRVAFAMVLSSILIASAIVIHAGIAPRWHGIPVFGLIGYASAGIMGALLLLAIIRHGRM